MICEGRLWRERRLFEVRKGQLAPVWSVEADKRGVQIFTVVVQYVSRRGDQPKVIE